MLTSYDKWTRLPTLWTGPFPAKGVSAYFSSQPCFKDIPVFNANSVDPNQAPRSAASYLDLHFLPVPFMGRYLSINRLNTFTNVLEIILTDVTAHPIK